MNIENTERLIFSFVIDEDPIFAFQGYHLALSLIDHCGAQPGQIHVQIIPGVSDSTRQIFKSLGCQLHTLPPFPDNKYCNKTRQVDNLSDIEFDRVILLDTDMIAIADIRPMLTGGDGLQAKIVDCPNPPIDVLNKIALAAGISNTSPTVGTDDTRGVTYSGNCNGGFYAISRNYAQTIASAWQNWARWLMGNRQPLDEANAAAHVDQVAMWLALQQAKVPFYEAPSNLNYYVHFAGQHAYLDSDHPIGLVHYHNTSMNVLGLIEPPEPLDPVATNAISLANKQISRHHHNELFWNFRYRHFPDRGSGIGSRGKNLNYKRELLIREQIESADSILDVGCGDLEVLRSFDLKNYLGLDQSEMAIARARSMKPDWAFEKLAINPNCHNIPKKSCVLCFEVLIHQSTREDYDNLVQFLDSKTEDVLFVSGYDANTPGIEENHMVFFHEPLIDSLHNLKSFSQITKIGHHTDVTIYRCEKRNSKQFRHSESAAVYAGEEQTVSSTSVKPHAWGIGLGRTGTTSLCAAFEILGYHPVAHNPPFDTLLTCQAAADNGCTIFYKFLDYRYPGSKFILTIREMESWLASFEQLHHYIARPDRMNVDSVLRRMMLYETVDFDRQKYIDAYRRHHDDVYRYFRDRPNDLLVMRIVDGEGWDKLCPFLSVPHPQQPFPYRFQMSEVRQMYGFREQING